MITNEFEFNRENVKENIAINSNITFGGVYKNELKYTECDVSIPVVLDGKYNYTNGLMNDGIYSVKE